MVKRARIFVFLFCFLGLSAFAQQPVWIPPNVPATPPGPSWIPRSRCVGVHTEPIPAEGFAALAAMAIYRQTPSPIEDLYDHCWQFPVSVTIPLFWWEYQQTDYCGEPVLNVVLDDGARRVCWLNRWQSIDAIIPATPARANPAKPGRMLIFPALNWPIRHP